MKLVFYQKNSEVWDFLFWLGFTMFFGSALIGFSPIVKSGMGWHYQTALKVTTLIIIVIGALFMLIGHNVSWRIQKRELEKMGKQVIRW